MEGTAGKGKSEVGRYVQDALNTKGHGGFYGKLFEQSDMPDKLLRETESTQKVTKVTFEF